jgi:hypothetical protein
MLTNFSQETLTVHKATVLGVAEGVSEDLVDRINAGKVSDLSGPVKPPRERKNKLLYDQLLQGKLDHLKPEERRHIKPVLIKFANLFTMGKVTTLNAPKLWRMKY